LAAQPSRPQRGGVDGGGRTSGPRSHARVAWVVLLVAWVCFMWGHSLVPGPASTAESDRVALLLRGLFAWLGVGDHAVVTFVVRKAAHFLEYAVMGLLLRKALGPGRRAAWLALALAIPSADEAIQLFVPGRSSSPRDVAIDFAGALTGLGVCILLEGLRARRARRTP
jgi:VanZ family protein